MSFNNQTIWIIGASSGIGKSLAKQLNDQNVTLILSARREEKLLELNKTLSGKHYVIPFDVADFSQTKQAIEKASIFAEQIDRIICLAGIYEPSTIDDMSDNDIKRIIAINLTGIIHFAQQALKIGLQQKHIQIAICASVAGYVGLPNAQPYAASKAGLINFVQSMKMEAPSHVDIKMINPGFVSTPLTNKNEFDMPFIIEAHDAAKRIMGGLESKSFDINFPKKLTLTLKIISILPNFLKLPICAKFK